MDFKLCTIASGSSGNCTFLQAGSKMFLIDVGISGKKAVLGLAELGVNPYDIQGVFITHEHIDHIKGVGIFSRKYDTPIYATHKAWDKIIGDQMIGNVKAHNIRFISKEEYFEVEDLSVFPYGIYHDAVDPVGYAFLYDNKKITIATDIGIVDERIKDHLKGSHGILLEFNHDINMLEAGTYPFYLKKRILSNVGHLNNEAAAEVLTDIYHKDMKWAILGHLSKDNNVPDLAFLTAKMALEEKNIVIDKDIKISVAKRDNVSEIHTV
ncbi:MBL fold metallo-hydrolase [Cellulosilyticum sp. I15G10I2]|uniref:MBL fold metallo-hydrolase n=1 Tax=Cellulosilyticum sp. I15G10I2 TaxID=1892843 RepID=UPI00085CD6DC|nr:MBL fold metallo-hydrolase [Cellulosilyticum sp. I15G10I2]